jgi:hypothetical protein
LAATRRIFPYLFEIQVPDERCCPNLNLNGIGNSPDKGLDLKVLLQGFKEGLNLSTLFVDRIDGRRILANQFVFKPELFLHNDLDTPSFKELKENLLIELPWTVLIGISQGEVARSLNAQMLELQSTKQLQPLAE